MADIDERRAELVAAIAKIGFMGAAQEGYLDVLVSDDLATPAVVNQLNQLQGITTDQSVRLNSLSETTQVVNGRVQSLQDTTSLQASMLSTLNGEVQRVDDSISFTESSTTQLIGRVSSLDTDVSGLKLNNSSVSSWIMQADSQVSEQEDRITNLESFVTGSSPQGLNALWQALVNKANLQAGKIPLAQLPELPAGRKVIVADTAERLSLSVWEDITIAYQTDNSTTYVLAADADPSVEANWSLFANNQADGVVTFNGRTGVVTASSGDYTTDMITQSADRGFVSDIDKSRWDAKANPADITSAVSALKTEAQNTYVQGNAGTFLRSDDTSVVKRSELAVNSGIATLGADGRVPTNQLPPLGMTTIQETRLANVETLADSASTKADNSLAATAALTTRVSAVEASGTTLTSVNNQVQVLNQYNVDTQAAIVRIDGVNTTQGNRLTSLEAIQSIPLAEKGATNGVATLGGNTKVPMAQLLTNTSGGVPTLDANSRVQVANLPAFLPQRKCIWRDMTASRLKGVWYKNGSASEMDLHVWTNTAVDAGFISISVRENEGSAVLTLPAVSASALLGLLTRSVITTTIPQDWEYSLSSANLGTRTIAGWMELS